MLQVITDIDDTIKSSGGVTLGGIPLGGVDVTYARGSTYPGVFTFAAELTKHSTGLLEPAANVAVLTARAREFKAFLEVKQSDKICVGFRKAGEALGGLPEGWGVGPVLYGSVAEWIDQSRKGWRKYENFKLLREQNEKARRSARATVPKALTAPARYVFIGDNGVSEKDREAAERIIAAFPDALDAVFLHAVSGDATQQPAPLPPDEEIGAVPVRYFRTYASAAEKAASLGLLGASGARRVLDAMEDDMRRDSVNVKPGSANERLLRDEIAAARARLGGAKVTLSPLRKPLRRPLRRLRRLVGKPAKGDRGGGRSRSK